ncbi:hypothetical protein IW261DRAFT_1482004 [Armillaria novae-zelandiae]|uniref:Uncharacterized protein n=1 Tax=Armillaria novae-zelandiae TaxID=153914 RepID=A0AA39P7Q2_9AGAR|nr:hypothetical protein IW261DRAFT_1482004 [Armillaria novae-zelandiae]
MSYLYPSFQLPHLASLILVPYVEARLVISQERSYLMLEFVIFGFISVFLAGGSF